MPYTPPIYPAQIPTITELFGYIDDIDWLKVDKWDAIRKELNAVLTELGTDPAGSLINLKTRLAVSLNDDGTLKSTLSPQFANLTLNNGAGSSLLTIHGTEGLRLLSPISPYLGFYTAPTTRIAYAGCSWGTTDFDIAILTATGKLRFRTGASGAIRQFIDANGHLNFSEANNIIFGATTGTKIGTAATQKIGFFNATPIIQPTNTIAIDTLLTNLGLRASGGSIKFDNNILVKTILPVTDNTYSLGSGGAAFTGIVFKDEDTAHYYRVYVYGGAIALDDLGI